MRRERLTTQGGSGIGRLASSSSSTGSGSGGPLPGAAALGIWQSSDGSRCSVSSSQTAVATAVITQHIDLIPLDVLECSEQLEDAPVGGDASSGGCLLMRHSDIDFEEEEDNNATNTIRGTNSTSRYDYYRDAAAGVAAAGAGQQPALAVAAVGGSRGAAAAATERAQQGFGAVISLAGPPLSPALEDMAGCDEGGYQQQIEGDTDMPDYYCCLTGLGRSSPPLVGRHLDWRGTAAIPPPSSARARLLCARVSVYTDTTSPCALAVANQIMSRVTLPGGVPFAPVAPDSVEFQMGVAWGFPAFAVALGASYFRRLLAGLPHLGAAAAATPGFAQYSPAAALCAAAAAPMAPCHQRVADVECSLRSAQATCIFLATKVADQVHAYGLLRFMLSALIGQRRAVSLDEAEAVELRCLSGLGWRLGPFFGHDPLAEDDSSLAALMSPFGSRGLHGAAGLAGGDRDDWRLAAGGRGGDHATSAPAAAAAAAWAS